MHCFFMYEAKKWKQLIISFSIQNSLLRPLPLLVEKNSLGLEVDILLGNNLRQIYLQLNLTTEKKSEIKKLHLNFKIRFKQK